MSNLRLQDYPGGILPIPASVSSPLIAKGDVYTHDATVDARLPVGATNQIITADPTTATGLRWVDAAKVTFGATGKDRNRPSPVTNADWLATDTFQYYKSDGSIWYNAASGWDKVTIDTYNSSGFTDATFFHANPGVNGGPTLTNPYTLCMGFYVVSLPGVAGSVLASYSNNASGWSFANSTVNANKLRLGLWTGAGFTFAELSGSVALTTGFHVMALNYNGAAIRYSLDGAAVNTVALVGAYTAPVAAADFMVGRFFSAGFSSNWFRFGFIQGYASVVADADLQTLGGNLSNFQPGVIASDPEYDFQVRWMRTEGVAGGVSAWQAYGTGLAKTRYMTCAGVGVVKTFQ